MFRRLGSRDTLQRLEEDNTMQDQLRAQWESAAPGWARWDPQVARWMAPATEAMMEMAGVVPGARVLDLASGAGSQTLEAARRVGPEGHVVANDIAESMLEYLRKNARDASLTNISTVAGPAEQLDLGEGAFDAAICRLGLMLFAEPARALVAVRRVLRPGGRFAAVVFTSPAANAFMARPMQILSRHAGKPLPAAGKPGVFALGGPGVAEQLLSDSGYERIDTRLVKVPLRMASAGEAVRMMRDAFAVYQRTIGDSTEAVQAAAWQEVEEDLAAFETPSGLDVPCEALVGAGAVPR
jgi:SAM-dependent methyltransferase